MPKHLLSLAAAAVLLLLIGNASSAHPAEAHGRVLAETIKDIMDSMIDPGAEALWDSVASYVSLKHVEQKAPRNDAQWSELRRRTVTLLTGAQLLLARDRHVAKRGDKSKNPSIELPPEQIEVLINNDRPAWTNLVRGLQNSGGLALDAIDNRDLEGLRSAGNALNGACEECHQKYWYPNRKKSLQQ
jgi:hypothetical protein